MIWPDFVQCLAVIISPAECWHTLHVTIVFTHSSFHLPSPSLPSSSPLLLSLLSLPPPLPPPSSPSSFPPSSPSLPPPFLACWGRHPCLRGEQEENQPQRHNEGKKSRGPKAKQMKNSLATQMTSLETSLLLPRPWAPKPRRRRRRRKWSKVWQPQQLWRTGRLKRVSL